jgi:dTDP-4-dehydrorhamnose reductase
MKILLLGAAGNLGTAFTELIATKDDVTLIGWDKADIDVTDSGLLVKKISELHPDIIINAVAYNDVDACENNEAAQALARKLNVEFVETLAEIALAHKAILIHYSSDYVFEGEDPKGYDEEAKPAPLSFYGQSKADGETELISASGKGLRWYLVRTSKLFGPAGASAAAKLNFFQLMHKLAKGTSTIQAVNDETGSFTYTRDLAQATLHLIESDSPFGIYHLINSGQASWYEAAAYFFKKIGKSIELQPVAASAFPRPAKRPHYSLLLNTKVPLLRSWQEALDDYIASEHIQ